MTTVIRILIADEYPIFCRGVKETLASSQEVCLVACVTCHSQLPTARQECQPDILLLSSNIAIPRYLETGLLKQMEAVIGNKCQPTSPIQEKS